MFDLPDTMEYVTEASENLSELVFKSTNCIWDTGELILDIVLEFVTRSVELAISVLALGFQVLCILRNWLFEAIRTFANTIKATVNTVGSIDTEDIEDFASACIVVVLWVGAGRLMLQLIEKNKGQYNPMSLFTRLMGIYNFDWKEPPLCPLLPEDTFVHNRTSSRKKKSSSRGRRSSKKR